MSYFGTAGDIVLFLLTFYAYRNLLVRSRPQIDIQDHNNIGLLNSINGVSKLQCLAIPSFMLLCVSESNSKWLHRSRERVA